MSTARLRAERARHPHHDAPETAADFERLAGLPAGPERNALRERLVAAWLPMAKRLAGKYRNRGETTEDLEQVAALGLFKAVDRYDPARGGRFESFAVPTVVGEIKRHFRDNTWDLHVPRRVQDLRNRVRRSVRALGYTADDRSPTVRQIAEHSGLSEEDVQLGLEALDSYSSLSLDARTAGGEDGLALLDTLGGNDAGYDHILYREAVKPRLRLLPERERHLLYLRFFCDETQSRIAERLGISQMHVSRLLTRTCDRIRREVDAERAPAAA